MSIKLIGADDGAGANEAKNYFILDQFTAVASGNMTEFRVKSDVAGYVKCAIYADSASYPGALITAMNTGQAVTGSGWETLSFTSTPIVIATVYWLAINISVNGAVIQTTQGITVRYKVATYSTFTFPDPAPAGMSSIVQGDYIAGWGAAAAAGRSAGYIIG